jgi:hypothetical protein
LKLIHQVPFVITYKATKHIINKNFSVVESPRRRQFSHQVELGFVAFIYRKYLTLFLGYNGLVELDTSV